MRVLSRRFRTLFLDRLRAAFAAGELRSLALSPRWPGARPSPSASTACAAQFLSKTAPFLVIDSSPAAREKALSRLLTLSASVSYTDAVVMAVADEYETQKIFGFDEAFANCGYENIPRWSEAEAA